MSLSFTNKRTVFSLEVFPPKDSVALQSIYDNMAKFAALNPDFISVTYGAGGSFVGASVEIASFIKNRFNITPVAHLTCAGSSRSDIDNALARFKENGIAHILALRGDLKEGRGVSDFIYASDLIKYIVENSDFAVSAACYPEGHLESPDNAFDFEVLKIKYGLGVRHFISQLFFDNGDFYDMAEKARAEGMADAKFEAGIMPITNAKQILRTVGISGAKLPAKLTKMISRYENNPQALRQAGMNYAIEQISDLITNGADGIHLYAMNNPLTSSEIYRSIEPMLGEVNK